ncbi:MAG: hypothetical protein M3O70_28025, partial [Actinomycetota bacterium]|nr:hypothetical protein [Actinomycetota bacterium]
MDRQEPGAGEDLGHRSPQEPAVAEGLVVLAKAERWRSDLWRLGSTTFAVLEIADDRPTAERAWRENVPPGLPRAQGVPAAPGVYGEFDDVDLATMAV